MRLVLINDSYSKNDNKAILFALDLYFCFNVTKYVNNKYALTGKDNAFIVLKVKKVNFQAGVHRAQQFTKYQQLSKLVDNHNLIL